MALSLALCFFLSGCGSNKRLSVVRTSEDGSMDRIVDSEKDIVYSCYKGHAYSVTPEEKFATFTSVGGEKITLYTVKDAKSDHFLTEKDGGVIWHSVPLPTPSSCVGDAEMKFSVCYSDGTDSVFSTVNDAEIIASIASALDGGTPQTVPAHDCETYYLKFSFGGDYAGISYSIGCIIDREEYVSYIYDRDRKETVSVGSLLSGRLPYSLKAENADAE